MAKTSDWLPTKRMELLVMVRNWIAILIAEIRTAWNIPQAQFTELEQLYNAADGLLQKAQSSERTSVITEQCKEAFDALIAKMRFFKSHYFLVPPLGNADLVNLGFTLRDPHPTRSGEPTAEVSVETFLVGRRELGIRFVYVSGNLEDKANDECSRLLACSKGIRQRCRL